MKSWNLFAYFLLTTPYSNTIRNAFCFHAVLFFTEKGILFKGYSLRRGLQKLRSIVAFRTLFYASVL